MANELYEILEQETGRLISPAGRATLGTVITFRSKKTGTTGQVEIVDKDYTPEAVDAAVRAKVATIDAIAGL